MAFSQVSFANSERSKLDSHLVDASIERGHCVRGLDNLVEQAYGPNVDRPAHLHSAAEFICFRYQRATWWVRS